MLFLIIINIQLLVIKNILNFYNQIHIKQDLKYQDIKNIIMKRLLMDIKIKIIKINYFGK